LDRIVIRALLTACWTACRAGREVSEEFAPIRYRCRMCAGARACRTEERARRALLASLQWSQYRLHRLEEIIGMSELPSRAADTAVGPVVVRSEDRLHAGTVNVVVGRARLITSVVVEEQTITVPVRRQQIRLVHEAVPESEQVVTDVAPAEETYEVVAYAEQVLVTTQVVPVERVRLITPGGHRVDGRERAGPLRAGRRRQHRTASLTHPLNNVTLEER
jgi:hypothetical protein